MDALNERYMQLGLAIILKAAKDYRINWRAVQKKSPQSNAYKDAKAECLFLEHFFRTSEVMIALDVDPEVVIRKIRRWAK